MLSIVLKTTERALNHALSESTQARETAADLNEHSLAIQLKLSLYAEPIRVRLSIQDGQFALNRDDEPASTTLTGEPISVLKLSGMEWTRTLKSSSAQIEGNAEIARQFEKLIKSLSFDVEGFIAERIGDKPAYGLVRMARHGIQFAQRQTRSITRQTIEYLTEESDLLLSRHQVNAFYDDVDRLRDASERLSAKLNLLTKRLTP